MQNTSNGTGFKLLAHGMVIACICAFAAIRISGGITNHFVYALAAQVFPAGREAATLLGGATYLGIALLALRRPQALNAKLLAAGACTLFIGAAVCLTLAVQTTSAPLLVAGMLARALATPLAMTLLGLCILRLDKLEQSAAVIAFGYLISFVVTPLTNYLTTVQAASVAMALLGCAVALFAGHFAQAPLAHLAAAGRADDIELLNPQAFLAPGHALFLCVMLFSAATGFALTLNEVENAPVQLGAEGFVAVLLILYLLLVRDSHQEDTLFSFSVLLVMAGLLVAPLTFIRAQTSVLPNTLLNLGGASFTVLLWLVYCGIGRRNLYSFLPVVGISQAFASLGTTLGAMAGHTVNGTLTGDIFVACSVCLAFAFFFLAFLWTGFRSFSFTDTINGVQVLPTLQTANSPTEAEEQAAVPPADATSYLDERCATLAKAAGLTPRETEIFTLMAKGRNGHFIMEHFTISRNTTKSHIKHVYTKLGIHSQQELIDLVEHN